jgi:SAM-dependent methyltransferase
MHSNGNQTTLESYSHNVGKYIEKSPQELDTNLKSWIDKILTTQSLSAKILEIGSGTGRDASYMESRGFRVIRSDGAPGFVSHMNTEGKHAVRLNILTDEITGQFDLIYANAVFLHFTPDELRLILSKIMTHLSPNGTLAFRTLESDAEERQEWSEHRLGAPLYFYHWPHEALERLLTVQGFEIKDVMRDKTTYANWVSYICSVH